MKINLSSIDTEQFFVNENIFNGEVVYLVIPKQMGCKWSKETKIFRSSVWNSDGELISASFPKFVNWGETPGVFPVPTSLNGCVVMEKIDGSTLIVSKYKGQFMIRTRGTTDASTMEKNGDEIQLFKETILPKLINYFGEDETWTNSIIFEWLSPLNKIVIDYGNEVKFILIGMINQSNYMIQTQSFLDEFAKNVGLIRPNTYTFTTIEDLISNVEQWEGKEGVVVYSKNGQELHKCKSFQYLKLHRFKSNATFENTVDLFFEFGMPNYQDFQAKLIEKFDYECFQLVQGYISIICDGYKEVNKIVQGMNDFVQNRLKPLPNRREQALTVFASYGKESNRSSFIFALLDGKTLDKEMLKKLLYQVTKS
jgi:hypothetical protein